MREERTILISTHILEEVDEVCNRAIIVSDGKVVGYGTPDELMSHSMYKNSVRYKPIPVAPAFKAGPTSLATSILANTYTI